MERTLEIMEEELKLIKQEYDVLNKKRQNLEIEIEEYKLNNGLYHPMSELINYIGKDIDSIKVVIRNEDGTLETDFLYCDEIFEVDEYGQLYYSSYSGGIIEYDNDAHKYVHMYYCRPTYYDYVGFMDLKLEDDDED